MRLKQLADRRLQGGRPARIGTNRFENFIERHQPENSVVDCGRLRHPIVDDVPNDRLESGIRKSASHGAGDVDGQDGVTVSRALLSDPPNRLTNIVANRGVQRLASGQMSGGEMLDRPAPWHMATGPAGEDVPDRPMVHQKDFRVRKGACIVIEDVTERRSYCTLVVLDLDD
jgi:hypothetical protein